MSSEVRLLMVLAEDIELFRTPDGKLYGTASVSNHFETWELRSAQFDNLLRRRYYCQTKQTPASQQVREVIRHLQAKAEFEGPVRPVFLRIGEQCGRSYLDLGNDNWDAAEIDADGWRVVANPPVKFRRAPGLQALPTPVRGGSIDELRPLVNLGNNELVLISGWLLAALLPSGPYPILGLHGEHGTTKTSLERMLRSLIDPSSLDVLGEPKNGHDLIIAANNRWVLPLDNLSRIPGWLSDSLCRLATGGGHSTRKLYSDSEEALFSVQRPVILNGIGELAIRGDLLDRYVLIELSPISPTQRRPESELWQAFDAAHPRILGALLDAVSSALQRLPTTKLPHYPRMADFALRVSAAEPAFGWDEGTFLKAYDQSQAEANEVALQASPISTALFALLKKGPFEGTTKNLLACLAKHADEATTKQSGWPRSERGLRAILDRLAPNLRAVGVEIRRRKNPDRGRDRMIRIQWSKPSGPSGPSEDTAAEETPSSQSIDSESKSPEKQHVEELRNYARAYLELAKTAKDSKGGAAVLREATRIEQFAHARGHHPEEQDIALEAICPPGIPLPGRPGGPPITENGRTALAEISKLSPAERMVVREGYTARIRKLELETQADKKGARSEQFKDKD